MKVGFPEICTRSVLWSARSLLSLFLSQLAGEAAHRPEYRAGIEANALILPACKQAGRMSGSELAALQSGCAAEGCGHEMGKNTFMTQAQYFRPMPTKGGAGMENAIPIARFFHRVIATPCATGRAGIYSHGA